MIDTNYNADPSCLLPPNPEGVYRADCASRRAKDATERMKLENLKRHFREGTRAGFLERQIMMPRKRAKAGREVLA